MKLKELRKLNKKTQAEVAEKAEVSLIAYNKYENNIRTPQIETLIKLADYYNVTLDYLVDRPYCNDLGYLTNEQSDVVKAILKLDEFNLAKVGGYVLGLLATQE